MTKDEIMDALKTGEKTEDEIAKLSPVSPTRLRRMLIELIFSGLISFDGTKYKDIRNGNLQLGKVVTKKASFVYLNLVRMDHMDVRLAGSHADTMLIGDYAYLYCDVDRFGPHDARFFCELQTIKEIKGNYRIGTAGSPELVIPYLEAANIAVAVAENKAEDVGIGDFVSATILKREAGKITVRIDRLLVKAGQVGSDISQIIAANDAPLNFPQNAIDEAKSIPQTLQPQDYLDRHDLREECIVTVDGEDSRDFDDAVSAKKTDYGWEVGIHIADVANYVKPGHPLDDEARSRGTSIYVADRVVPMLPVELSNGICSLNPNVDRLTLTCRAQIDRNGNVFKSEIYPSVIRSHGRLTYTQVNELYKTGKSDSLSPEIQDTLHILKECADAVRARRERQGTMKLDSVELHFNLDEKGFPIEVEKKTQDVAELMIEDMMIVANCEVAKFLHAKDIPTLYRIHEVPPEEKLAILIAYVKKLGLIKFFPPKGGVTPASLNRFMAVIKDPNLKKAMSIVLLRSMAKARYSPDEVGHFGLAEPEYLHFTSPIRRYPDTVVHRTLHDFVFANKPLDKKARYDQLKDLGDDLSADEKRAQTIERSVDDLESAKYMSARISQKFHGFIVSFIDFGMFVQLDNGIEGLLPFEYINENRFFYDDKHLTAKDTTTDREYNLGEEIDVCVFACNVSGRKVTFCSPEFMDELGRNLSPEQLASLKSNNAAIMTESQYLAHRHQEYMFKNKRPRFGGFRSTGASFTGFHHDAPHGGDHFHSNGFHHDDHRAGGGYQGHGGLHRPTGPGGKPAFGDKTHYRHDDNFRFAHPKKDLGDGNNGGSTGGATGSDDPSIGE